MKKRITIDLREPKVYADWFEQRHYEVTKENIKPSGDFRFHNDDYDVIIERKTVSDFDSSFTKYDLPNMWDQCQRMVEFVRETGGYAHIIIIGDTNYDNQHAEVTPQSRIGAVGSIMTRYQIPVTFVANEYSSFLLMDKIFRSHSEGKVGQARELTGFKKSEGSNMWEGILMKVSGVHNKRAKDIVKTLKIDRIHDICVNCTSEALTSVSGIGKKTAAAIRSELGIWREGDEDLIFKTHGKKIGNGYLDLQGFPHEISIVDRPPPSLDINLESCTQCGLSNCATLDHNKKTS